MATTRDGTTQRARGTALACATLYLFSGLSACTVLVDPPAEVSIPRMPAVSVTPSSPLALEDLSVTVTNPQTEVDYSFEWCRLESSSSSECEVVTDGVQISLHSSTLPSSQVLKRFPEVWRVVVTPNIRGTDVEGPAFTRDITIADTPSRLVSARLNRYRVIVGQALQAFPTSFYDPDNPEGADVGLRYQWYRTSGSSAPELIRTQDVSEVNDGDSFTLGDGSLLAQPVPGDTITLSVLPLDGSNLTQETDIGPVKVLADTTRWVPLLPQRAFNDLNIYSAVYDEANERFLILDNVNTWEAEVVNFKTEFAKLYPDPNANPTVTMGTSFDDDLNGKPQAVVLGFNVAFLGGDGQYSVQMLDVSQRGNESWSFLTPTGAVPAYDANATTFYDRAHNRFFVMKSCAHSAPYIYRLDIGASAAVWTRLTFSESPGMVEKSTVIPHPMVDNRFLVIGGTTSTLEQTGTNTWICTDKNQERSPVYLLDVANASAPTMKVLTNSANRSVLSPEPHVYPAAVAHPDGNRIIVAEGMSNQTGNFLASTDMWVLDLSAAEFVTDALPASRAALASASGTFNTFRNRFEFWRRDFGSQITPLLLTELEQRSSNSFIWNRNYYETGVHLPPEIYQNQVWGSGTITELTGGLLGDGQLNRSHWLLSASERSWTLLSSSLGGRNRTNVVVAARADIPFNRYVIRGTDENFGLPSSPPWVLDSANHEWRITTAGASALNPSVGSLLVPLANNFCSGGNFLEPEENAFLAFGGFNFVVEAYYSVVRCTNGETCQAAGSSLAPAAPRASPAAAMFGTDSSTRVVMFGGSDGISLFNDLWQISPCNAPSAASWISPVVDMDLVFGFPQGRHGSSLSLILPSAPGFQQMILSGGLNISNFLDSIDPWTLNQLGGGHYSWDKINVDTDSEEPPPRGFHSATWDTSNSALIIYGGSGLFTLSDMWELRIRD